MILVESVLGSAADEVWADRLRAARIDVLRLDQAEAHKSRLRKTTSSATEVAVSLDRGTQLRDGDVLFWDERGQVAIVARVDLKTTVGEASGNVVRHAYPSGDGSFEVEARSADEQLTVIVRDSSPSFLW